MARGKRGSTDQLTVLQRAVARSGLSSETIWKKYFSLGGTAGLVEIEACIAGLMPLDTLEPDVLAHAVNELLDEQTWPERVPYTRTVHQPRPESGPLAAMLRAVEGMHLAPPDRLPVITARAAEALGVQITVYLADYEQQSLHPLLGPGPGAGAREVAGIDTSLAGRAYRTLDIYSSRSDGEVRLWVPLLDGVERLGALEVVLGEATESEADGPAFRAHLTWLSALLGHLVTATTRYGDGLDQVRRRRPRNAAAELIWQLLPPTTAGTDKVVVAGMLEPCYTVGGDAFDYSLSEATASLAIFDATGHSLGSGSTTAMAMSAYRSVRRNGVSLFDQAAAVDEVISSEFDRTGRLVTSVLGELDLRSGRLRYISAGHPAPLVVRGGKVVKSLEQGRRSIFGLPTRELTVGEENLEPGDWLVLYTDGITEARDESGSRFGTDRLEDFLERETAAGHPPPEMVRRLVGNVMNHQQGVLQDDATVLVTRWADLTRELTPHSGRAARPPDDVAGRSPL